MLEEYHNSQCGINLEFISDLLNVCSETLEHISIIHDPELSPSLLLRPEEINLPELKSF